MDQIVPADVGRVAGLGGDLYDPADATEHPLATATLLMSVRVPDTREVTRMPLTVSLPLVAAAAGKTVAAEMASVIPAPSSAPDTRDSWFLLGSSAFSGSRLIGRGRKSR